MPFPIFTNFPIINVNSPARKDAPERLNPPREHPNEPPRGGDSNRSIGSEVPPRKLDVIV